MHVRLHFHYLNICLKSEFQILKTGETFQKSYLTPNFVIPAPHQVRDKLQPESSIFKDFLDSPVPGSGPEQASRGMTPVVDSGSLIPD